MPQSVSPQGWLLSGQIPSPARVERLAMGEVDKFLAFLFHDVAYPSKPLRVREVVRVVRYLDALATTGVPTNIRKRGITSVNAYCAAGERDDKGRLRSRDWAAKQSVSTIATALWSALRQSGDIKPATKSEVIACLETHRANYLPRTVDTALAFVRDAEPVDLDRMFQPPALISRSHMVRPGGRRLQNDLSERIAIAKIALKAVLVSGVDARIAQALELHQCPRRDRSTEWVYSDIHERAKEFNRAFNKKHSSGTKVLRSLVATWIFRFRYSATSC